MDSKELFELTIGFSYQEYKEFQRGLVRSVNREEKDKIYKYKVTLTAKSKSNGILYCTLLEAINAEIMMGSKYHVYKLIEKSTSSYWKKMY